MQSIKYHEMPLEQAIIEALHSLASGTHGASISSISQLVRTQQTPVRAMVEDLHTRGIVGWKEGSEGRHWYLVADRE